MLAGDISFAVINKMLDGATHRHKVLAGNIANAETPGYRRLEVRFEDQLADAIRSGQFGNLTKIDYDVTQTQGLPVRPDGNNVDFGRELGDMTKNTLVFSTFTQMAASRVKRYREAIGGP